MHILYNEDFKDFPLDEFPYDKGHTALGEYHYIKQKGYYGNWYDPICNHQWRSMDGSWIITNYDNVRFLTQNRGDYSTGHYASVYSLLILREKLYSSYTMEFKLRILSKKKYAGVVFNYLTSRNYYAIGLKDGHLSVIYRNQEDETILADRTFSVDEYKLYKIKVIVNNHLKVYVDGELLLECNVDVFPSKCGVFSKVACRYTDFKISMNDMEYNNHLTSIKNENYRLMIKRKEYSLLECIKKIDLGVFGTGRQIRFAHKPNGEVFFIFAQHQKLIMRDSFAQISSLSAIDQNGKVLWTIGEPNNSIDNTRISCDLPFQVADINNDGKDELIYSRDFYIIIVDAYSGKEIKRIKTPVSDESFGDYPYDRLNVDMIRVCDFEGLGYQGGIIVKDRYKNVFAYNHNLEIIWKYHYKNTGHFPYIYDFNGDGKDEMYVGYSMVDSNGEIKWSLPIESDHTDEIIYTNTIKEEPKRLYLASGNEGFNIVNMNGSVYKHNEIGHAQRISIANYNKDSVGLDICVTSFWGANDIIYMFDAYGNKVLEKEFMSNGNVITPVAYDGEHELILASGYVGLLDNNLDIVVKFPTDGHPKLCADAYDLDSDGIDEILCWDEKSLFIYKAKKFKPGNKYEKYPKNAMSNYRGEFLIKKE